MPARFPRPLEQVASEYHGGTDRSSKGRREYEKLYLLLEKYLTCFARTAYGPVLFLLLLLSLLFIIIRYMLCKHLHTYVCVGGGRGAARHPLHSSSFF